MGSERPCYCTTLHILEARLEWEWAHVKSKVLTLKTEEGRALRLFGDFPPELQHCFIHLSTYLSFYLFYLLVLCLNQEPSLPVLTAPESRQRTVMLPGSLVTLCWPLQGRECLRVPVNPDYSPAASSANFSREQGRVRTSRRCKPLSHADRISNVT